MSETTAQFRPPAPPPDAVTQWRVDADQLILDIPPTGFSMSEYRVMVAVAVVLFCVGSAGFIALAAALASQTKVALSVRAVYGIGFGVVCYAVPVTVLLQGILWPACRRTQVTASPQFLRVQRRLAGFRTSREIPAEELMELVPPAPEASGTSGPEGNAETPSTAHAAPRLFAAGTPAVVARGTKFTLRFGQGLRLPELQWIHGAITQAMSRDQQRGTGN